MRRLSSLAISLAGLLLAIPPAARADDAPRVATLRVPSGGLQPQAIADAEGTIHLVAFRGDPASGDLFYSARKRGDERFSEPIRINSQAGSAIALGTIRGAQLALGRDGRVHVAWNGSNSALPKNAAGSTPMLYARSDAARAKFEPQRNLMRRTSALDGGGSIAADREGRVFVAWHGRAEDSDAGESGRALYVARSNDDGETFADEVAALDRPTGACPCCGTRSLADARGNLYILFRAAGTSVRRDLVLVTSRDGGKGFRSHPVHPWTINACPMSSESLAEANGTVIAAWETAGRVYFARVDPASGPSEPLGPPKKTGQKHPSVAVNDRGQVLLAWAEGTGWQKGGDLAWQVFAADGTPLGKPGRVEGGIPAWGLAAAVAMPDGSFAIVH